MQRTGKTQPSVVVEKKMECRKKWPQCATHSGKHNASNSAQAHFAAFFGEMNTRLCADSANNVCVHSFIEEEVCVCTGNFVRANGHIVARLSQSGGHQQECGLCQHGSDQRENEQRNECAQFEQLQATDVQRACKTGTDKARILMCVFPPFALMCPRVGPMDMPRPRRSGFGGSSLNVSQPR